MMIIDATDSIIGRLASYAAKQALYGEKIAIINSEKAVIGGKQRNVYNNYLRKRGMGTPRKGPFFPRMPDRLLKRTIRGMLPYKKPRGKEAFKRIRCYIGVPEEFSDKKSIKVEGAQLSKLPNLKYVYLRDLSKRLGAKIE